MKKITSLILLLTCTLVFSQNQNIQIPDSLNSKEIRITRSVSWVKTEILRIYFNSNSDLIFELLEKDKSGNFGLIKNRTLPRKDDYDKKLWLKILMTDIHHIADYQDIKYKFKKDKEIIFFKDKWTIFYNTSHSLDGVGYEIEISGEEKYNSVRYSNPDSFLNTYPEIDELKSVVDLLNLIRNEFNIWAE